MIGSYGSSSSESKKTIDEENMSSIDIMQKVIKRKLKGVMFHDDLQNSFDFLDMHGFKREQEYRTLSEMAEFKSLCRYVINHYDKMPDKKVDRVEVNPLNLKFIEKRKDVSPEQKKQMLKMLFEMWCEWEEETIEILECYVTALAKMEHNVDSIKVKSLLEDVTMEYKYIERRLIEYNNVGWELHHIYSIQHDIHEHFKEKLKEEIKIDIC